MLLHENPSPNNQSAIESPVKKPKPGQPGFTLEIKESKLAGKRLSRNDVLAISAERSDPQGMILKPLEYKALTLAPVTTHARKPIKPLKLPQRKPIKLTQLYHPGSLTARPLNPHARITTKDDVWGAYGAKPREKARGPIRLSPWITFAQPFTETSVFKTAANGKEI